MGIHCHLLLNFAKQKQAMSVQKILEKETRFCAAFGMRMGIGCAPARRKAAYNQIALMVQKISLSTLKLCKAEANYKCSEKNARKGNQILCSLLNVNANTIHACKKE